MAAAGTAAAMELQDHHHRRRLSISKSSPAKISKSSSTSSPSSSSSAPIAAGTGAAASSAASHSLLRRSESAPSSSPPPPNSRPVAKIVNADPSSFRRVVQELTGTGTGTGTIPPSASSPSPSPPSSSSSPSPSPPPLSRHPSRLQRIAPPPLRSPDPHRSPQNLLLLQQQQQQPPPQHPMFRHTPPPISSSSAPSSSSANPHLVASHRQDLYRFDPPQLPHLPFSASFPTTASSSLPSHPPFPHPHVFQQNPNPPPHLLPQNTNPPNPGNFASDANPNFDPHASLPMLSPHLLSPLPALTPGDSSWANPLDAVLPSSPMASFAPLPPIPATSGGAASISSHGVLHYSNAPNNLSFNYAPSHHGYSMGSSSTITSSNSNNSHQNMALATANLQAAQNLGPILPSPASPSAAPPFGWSLPPWSPTLFPSPPPFSPAIYPPSPTPAVNTGTAAALFNSIRSTTTNPANDSDFSFRGPPSEYKFRPSF